MLEDYKKIPWDEYIKLLDLVMQETNTINLPIEYTYNGISIGKWLARKRNEYHKGILNHDKIAKLESMGMIWNREDYIKHELDEKWDYKYSLASAYYKEHSNLIIPRHFTIEDVDLGQWLVNQKTNYKKQKLSHYRIRKLEQIGIDWNFCHVDSAWSHMYNIAVQYFHKYGNLHIAQSVRYEEENLGNWVHAQTQKYKKGKLSEDKIKLLNLLNIRWSPRDDRWEENFQCALLYYNHIGNLDVPYDFIYKGIALGRWISVQRAAYNGRKDCRLTKQEISRLSEIGMKWDKNFALAC